MEKMSVPLSSTEPLEPAEYEAITRLLSGEQGELELLRYQVQSVCYASEFYRPKRILGMERRPCYVARRTGDTHFSVQWGVGGEDWMLGDRRQFRTNDVLARLTDSSVVQLGLVVEKGLVSRLEILGGWSSAGQRLTRHGIKLNWEKIETFLFFDGEDPGTSSQNRLSGKDLAFSPPPHRRDGTEWASWFAGLEHLRIQPPRAGNREYQAQLPLRVRRAWPATVAEIEQLERKHDARISEEVRAFWLASNGASFLGWPVCGTYDTELLDWPGDWRFLLIGDVYGDGSVITVQATRDGATSGPARVFHDGAESQEPLRTWTSLEECFTDLLAEVQREADKGSAER